MENYQKLFNQERPQKEKNLDFGNLSELEKNLKSEWNSELQKGLNAHNEKNYPMAITFLNKAIELKSDNPNLYKIRAKIKEDSEDTNGAISDYKKSLYISSDIYTTYNQIGINYTKRKEFDKALIAFNIAIEQKFEIQQNGIDESLIPYIQDAIVMKVDYEKMFTNRANVKMSLQDYEGCADDCNSAIKINPEYSNSYFVFGMLFLTVEQNDNALKLLKIAESKGHKHASKLISQFF
jgi:tetratricopeptide (TPR) repeat protein